VLYLYLASLLAIEGPIDRDAIFRLIQPAFVYRRLVNGEPIPQCPTLCRAEAGGQRFLGVGTQVVHDQMDGLRRGIAVGY
jgi:hypothetical protein